jgi:hypothetical protein
VPTPWGWFHHSPSSLDLCPAGQAQGPAPYRLQVGEEENNFLSPHAYTQFNLKAWINLSQLEDISTCQVLSHYHDVLECVLVA